MYFGNIFGKYRKYIDITYRYYLLWWINGSNDAYGYAKW